MPPQGSPDGGPNGGNNTPPDGEDPTGENKPEGDGDQPPTGEQPPAEGDGATADAIPTPEDQDGVEAVQIQGEPPPQTGEPTPVSGSLLIREKGFHLKVPRLNIHKNKYRKASTSRSLEKRPAMIVKVPYSYEHVRFSRSQ